MSGSLPVVTVEYRTALEQRRLTLRRMLVAGAPLLLAIIVVPIILAGDLRELDRLGWVVIATSLAVTVAIAVTVARRHKRQRELPDWASSTGTPLGAVSPGRGMSLGNLSSTPQGLFVRRVTYRSRLMSLNQVVEDQLLPWSAIRQISLLMIGDECREVTVDASPDHVFEYRGKVGATFLDGLRAVGLRFG